MKPYPQINKDHFVLTFCERNTGIILDVHFNRCTNDNQEVYEIFSSLDSAIVRAKNIISDRHDIECNIFDYEYKIVTSLDVDNYNS